MNKILSILDEWKALRLCAPSDDKFYDDDMVYYNEKLEEALRRATEDLQSIQNIDQGKIANFANETLAAIEKILKGEK